MKSESRTGLVALKITGSFLARERDRSEVFKDGQSLRNSQNLSRILPLRVISLVQSFGSRIIIKYWAIEPPAWALLHFCGTMALPFRILAVDDEPAVAFSLRHVFAGPRYEILSVEDGLAALARLEDRS